MTKTDSRARRRDEAKDWTTSGILPRVVHRQYFDATGAADVTVEPNRFGFVRPLGNDLYAFLAYSDKIIRNVHQEHLDQMKLSLDGANEIALDNLRKIAFDGSTIRRVITTTEAGNGSASPTPVPIAAEQSRPTPAVGFGGWAWPAFVQRFDGDVSERCCTVEALKADVALAGPFGQRLPAAAALGLRVQIGYFLAFFALAFAGGFPSP